MVCRDTLTHLFENKWHRGIDNPSLDIFATFLVHRYLLEFWVIAANGSGFTFSRSTSMAADGSSIEAATRRSLSVVRSNRPLCKARHEVKALHVCVCSYMYMCILVGDML